LPNLECRSKGGATLRIAQERGERAKKKVQIQPQRGVDFTNEQGRY